MDWENHLEKNPIKKSKTKNQSEIAACEQETTSDKANFFQTPFSNTTLNLEQKKIKRRKPTRFFALLPVSA